MPVATGRGETTSTKTALHLDHSLLTFHLVDFGEEPRL
jgi:hypothetical protein